MSVKDLVPGVGNLHGPPRGAGEASGDNLERNHLALAPETATHQGLDYANPIHRQPEHIRQCPLQVVGHLSGGPDYQAPVVLDVSQGRVRLHGHVGHARAEEVVFADGVRLGKTFFHVAKVVVVFLFDVMGLVVVDPVRLRLHGLAGVEEGRQEFVVHFDQIQSLHRSLVGDGGDRSDVIAHVARLINSKRSFIVADGQDTVPAGKIFAGDDCDNAGQGRGLGGINGADTRMRMRTVQNPAHQHAGQHQVVGINAGAGDLFPRVHHRQALADNRELRHPYRPPLAAATGVVCNFLIAYSIEA